MAEEVAIHEMVYDENMLPVDYIITSINPAYIKHTEINSKIIGMKASELYRTGKPPYFEIYKKVVEIGEPASFETLILNR